MPTEGMCMMGNQNPMPSSAEQTTVKSTETASAENKTASVPNRTAEQMEVNRDQPLRLSKTQLRQALLMFRTCNGGCTGECKRRVQQMEKERHLIEDKMKLTLMKVHEVAKNLTSLATIISDKFTDPLLRKQMNEALKILSEVCSSFAQRDETTAQLPANGTETNRNACVLSNDPSSSTQSASGMDHPPEVASSRETNICPAIKRRHAPIALRAMELKKRRDNDDEDIIIILSDDEDAVPESSKSVDLASGVKTEDGTDDITILSDGENEHTQTEKIMQNGHHSTTMNRMTVIKLSYSDRKWSGHVPREHPLFLPSIDASPMLPVLKISLGNSPQDITSSRRVLLDVTYEIRSKKQKICLFYYLRSLAETDSSYSWQYAVCTPCNVNKHNQLLFAFDYRQSFMQEVLYAVGYVEANGRRGQWSNVCIVNVGLCASTDNY